MNCPECSAPLDRSHRHGFLDKVRCLRGHRPYRCFKCNKRFFLLPPVAGRPVTPGSEARGEVFNPPPVVPVVNHSAPGKHPEIRLEVDREKPMAQLTIEADSHQELENLLTALNEAVVRYENVEAEKS